MTLKSFAYPLAFLSVAACSSSGGPETDMTMVPSAGGTTSNVMMMGTAGTVDPNNTMNPGPTPAGGGATTTVITPMPGTGGTTVAANGGTAPMGTGGTPPAGTGGMMASMGGTPAGTGGAPVALPPGPAPTSGCDQPDPFEQPQTWLQNDITVADLPADQVDHFGQRQYWVRLPNNYDHTRPYPLVFYGPGCGASNVEGTPMMNAVSDDAIHVFLLQKDSCFSTGGYPSPEVPYFTQALDEIQAKYCTDAKNVFVSGYSSGGWLSNVLACALEDRIRGIGTAAGGISKDIDDGYSCDGNVAGILYTGENDTANPADNVQDGWQRGVLGARDLLIEGNGCDPNASEMWSNEAGADFCEIWKTGCENSPVIYCVGPGDGHGNGSVGNVSTQGFWEFWSGLGDK